MDDDMKKREALKTLYPNSTSWAEKVAKMSPAQVTAVYLRLRAQGKI